MKKFYMLRHEDSSGYSGTGVVAEGVIFDDGTGAFTWLTPMKTVTTFWKINDIIHMHGKNGKSEIVFEGGKGYALEKYKMCEDRARALKVEMKLKKGKKR
jgi:hypothetical protein